MTIKIEENLTRHTQMDTTNLEYRVQQLEREQLPHRISKAEFTLDQLQGEVKTVKEIARNIATRLDAGIERLAANSAIEIGKLQAEQIKALSFIRGLVWAMSGLIGFIGLAIMVAPILKKLMT